MIHESTLSVDSPAWLDDHRLAGIAVLPGSAFAEMALAAADSSDTIESLNIHEALVLPANGDVTVQTIVTGPANRQEVQILSLEPGDVAGGGWKVHATATMLRSTGFATGNEPLDLGAAVAGFDEDLDVGAYYAQQKPKGLAAKDPELVKLGQALYRGGDATKGIPACAACHGSPHTMGPSPNDADNVQAIHYQGEPGPIGKKCSVCHGINLPKFVFDHKFS